MPPLLQAALKEIAQKADMVKSFTPPRTMHFCALCLNGFLPFKLHSFILRKHLTDFDLALLLKNGAWDGIATRHTRSPYDAFIRFPLPLSVKENAHAYLCVSCE